MSESRSQSFFVPENGRFVPGPEARSPWGAEMMHGRLLAGLLARSAELEYGDPDLHSARLTVDLFRSPPMSPVQVSTSLSRDGNRIRVADASATIEGVEVARASVVMLRRAEHPPGNVWAPPEWSVPHPDELAPPARPQGQPAGPGWMPSWETRTISRGGFGTAEPKRAWLREVRDLVAGEDLTPFVRAAVACDYANPWANSGDRGLNFINADITLYLHRMPVDEWIGFEVAGSRGADGVAVGQCTLYDTAGAIGHSLVCAVANQRMSRPPRP